MATRRWGGGLQTQRRLQAQYWSPVEIPTSLIFVYCKNGFCTNSFLYLRICISRLIHSLRVICVVSDIVCSVAQSVTCDGASLRKIFKLPLLEAEDSSQMLLVRCFVVSCSALKYFIFHPICLKQIAAV